MAAASGRSFYRSHTCGELRLEHVGLEVTLSGWVQVSRDQNHFAFIDLRDRYGITQCICNNPGAGGDQVELQNYKTAQGLGREDVIQVKGKVVERVNKNPNRTTGDIEIVVSVLSVLNASKTPPFKIQDETDANEDTRMKYRYLDIRRAPVRDALILRYNVTRIVRNYLGDKGFLEIETPVLIKSTPEGARDFVVPSRITPGTFYALPQSPQTFKQLLMVAGMDKYFQIVKCFRDEELRADRQPEFTQIDCEMAFVDQEDILNLFEGMVKKVYSDILGHDFGPLPRMTYAQAMEEYGSDKPDLRFEMKLHELTDLVRHRTDFKVFAESEYIGAISCPGVASWSAKKIKALEKLVKNVCGADNFVYVKVECLKPGEEKFTNSAKKFFDDSESLKWANRCNAKENDCIFVFYGQKRKTQEALGRFRAEMGTELGFRKEGYYALWVVDFPLLEWDEDEKRYLAVHHPFTSPKLDDIDKLETDPLSVRANAYDLVINGMEAGGGSIRIHNKQVQQKMFDLLGFTKEQAEAQFGFLMNAFEYGAPPHGGIAFGLDRFCALLGNASSIRDYMAFPKNQAGRDTMIDAPAPISQEQMQELFIASTYSLEDDLKKNAKMSN